MIPFANPDLERIFLEPKPAFGPEFLKKFQREIPREIDRNSLTHVETLQPTTSLEISRDITTGKILGYHEVSVDDASQNAKNSSSMLREPAPYADFVRGKNAFKPFKPGGLDETEDKEIADFLVSQGSLFFFSSLISFLLVFNAFFFLFSFSSSYSFFFFLLLSSSFFFGFDRGSDSHSTTWI